MKSSLLPLGALAAAASLALAGCMGEAPADAPATAEAAADPDELAKRLAFMAGHVEAGIALYRAGEGAAGGPHLLHPVSESYAEEREGLDAIGFDPAPFEAVSEALEAGRPAGEIEPRLAEVEANLAEMRAAAGGDAEVLIAYLMDLVAEEYRVGVTDGAVTDAGEYQDAWGFAVVARRLADGLSSTKAAEVKSDIDALISLWPEGAPKIPKTPADPDAVAEQAAKVTAQLS
ncbi:hypothetical protein [Erythrobacter rubeus]|uniref:DUF305 domain-containing protein n=1 Tax=Erythrobacter rubeus TaxID=2760803 RepID=A0ABR8KPD2_9SPHN|nr:hypothetical protein [Erythrobacter rubeus]MBD2841130.1 hypothetical protein [Erythrobacter rubeus]